MRIEIEKQLKSCRRKFRLSKALMLAMILPVLLVLGITQAAYIENALGSTETTETNLGTYTIPPTGVSRIIGVYGINHGVQTTGEECSSYFRIAFGTGPNLSLKFPCQICDAGAGTLAGLGIAFDPKIIPVDIPLQPNDVITAYMTQFVASTGARRGMVGFIFG